jgi:hypothetical protein
VKAGRVYFVGLGTTPWSPTEPLRGETSSSRKKTTAERAFAHERLGEPTAVRAMSSSTSD